MGRIKKPEPVKKYRLRNTAGHRRQVNDPIPSATRVKVLIFTERYLYVLLPTAR